MKRCYASTWISLTTAAVGCGGSSPEVFDLTPEAGLSIVFTGEVDPALQGVGIIIPPGAVSEPVQLSIDMEHDDSALELVDGAGEYVVEWDDRALRFDPPQLDLAISAHLLLPRTPVGRAGLDLARTGSEEDGFRWVHPNDMVADETGVVLPMDDLSRVQLGRVMRHPDAPPMKLASLQALLAALHQRNDQTENALRALADDQAEAIRSKEAARKAKKAFDEMVEEAEAQMSTELVNPSRVQSSTTRSTCASCALRTSW